MLAILLAHAVATALAPLLVHRWGRKAFYPLALVPLGSLVWVALNWPGPAGATTVDVAWVPELSMNITLRFDALAAIMSVLVLGIGALVLFYCADYFHHPTATPRSGCPVSPPSWSRSPARCSAWSQRQHAGALRVLGTDHRAVVPVGRPLRRTRHQQASRHPGAAGDDVRRAGDAGRHRRARQHVRHLSVVRADRRRRRRAWRRRSASRWCSSARCRNRRSCRCISGCPARWPRRRRSARTCTPRRW